MPELRCGGQRWAVAAGDNLLDALRARGVLVPFSCRAGLCQTCLVRCVDGEPDDARPEALTIEQRRAGWRLACQCRVRGDLDVAVFDPSRQGIGAQIEALDWPGEAILRVQLTAERSVRFQPGQHLVLWADDQLARPYSMASLPGETPRLEFHIDCAGHGAIATAAERWRVGDRLHLGALGGGALHYLPEWSGDPLWLIAGGTGLAPLWSLLRQALASGHEGPVHLVHVARPGRHYLDDALKSLQGGHPTLTAHSIKRDGLDAALQPLRLQARRSQVLVCGSEGFVEACRRQLFLTGVPPGRVHVEAFVARAPG